MSGRVKKKSSMKKQEDKPPVFFWVMLSILSFIMIVLIFLIFSQGGSPNHEIVLQYPQEGFDFEIIPNVTVDCSNSHETFWLCILPVKWNMQGGLTTPLLVQANSPIAICFNRSDCPSTTCEEVCK